MKNTTLALSCALITMSTTLCMESEKPPIWQQAGEYDENSQRQLEISLLGLKEFSIKQNAHILELGCGTGNLAAKLAHDNPGISIVATDISPEMIQHAQNKHFSSAQISFAVQDAQHLPEEYTEEFNHVLCGHVIHWTKNHQAVLNGASRSLKPGGTLWMIGGRKVDHNNMLPIFTAFSALKQKAPWQETFKSTTLQSIVGIYPGINADTLESMLKNAGLKPIKLDTEFSPPALFKDKVALKKFLTPLAKAFPQFLALTEKDREDFLEDLIKEYLTGDEYAKIKSDDEKNGVISYLTGKNILLIAQKQ